MDPMVTEALPAVVGAGVGGASVLWFAKLMLARLLKDYDDNIKQLSSAVNELKIKLAVLEVTVSDAKNMRGDIQAVQGRTAIIEAHLTKAHERIDNVKSDVKKLTT